MASNIKAKATANPPLKSAVSLASKAAFTVRAGRVPKKSATTPAASSPTAVDHPKSKACSASSHRLAQVTQRVVPAEPNEIPSDAQSLECAVEDDVAAHASTCIGNPFAMLIDPQGHQERVAGAPSLARLKGLQYKPVEFPMLDRQRRLFDVFDPETGDMVQAPTDPNDGPLQPPN